MEKTGFTGKKILDSQKNLYLDPWKSNIMSGFIIIEVPEEQILNKKFKDEEIIKVYFIRYILFH